MRGHFGRALSFTSAMASPMITDATTIKLSIKHLAKERMQVETDRMMLRMCFGVRSCMLAGHPESGATEVYPLSPHLLAK
jgi:hypothetical protein